MTVSVAPNTGSARPARTDWPLALVLVGAGVAGALQIGKAVAALPTVRADLGLSLGTAGWLLSVVNLAGALAGLLIGAAADRIGHRRAVLAGLVVTAVCGAAGGRTRDAAAAGHPLRGRPRSRAGRDGRSRAAGPGHRRRHGGRWTHRLRLGSACSDRAAGIVPELIPAA
jgi:MFS transporter